MHPSRLKQHVLSLADFERIARRRLPAPIHGYVSGACEDNLSLDASRKAFADIELRTRVLVDISQRSAACRMFDVDYDAPFGIAPMGVSALSAYRGDVVLAEAARRARVPAIMSGWSLVRLEEVAQAAPDTWFQAYLARQQQDQDALIARVEAAGFRTLVITVDTPAPANRENNLRAGFSSPLRPTLRLALQGLARPRWLAQVFVRTLLRHGMPHFENWDGGRGLPIISNAINTQVAQRGSLTWQHVRTIRRRWKGPLVLKGILSAEDAVLAAEQGVDGIIVSNHGGRQLDGAATPLRVLPAIVEAFRRGPVMLDGGVRRGTDVIKALALGASCVFIGRPFNYAAAVAGSAGVDHAIELLRQEVLRDMAMMGVTSTAQLDGAFLLHPGPAGRASSGPAPALRAPVLRQA